MIPATSTRAPTDGAQVVAADLQYICERLDDEFTTMSGMKMPSAACRGGKKACIDPPSPLLKPVSRAKISASRRLSSKFFEPTVMVPSATTGAPAIRKAAKIPLAIQKWGSSSSVRANTAIISTEVT